MPFLSSLRYNTCELRKLPMKAYTYHPRTMAEREIQLEQPLALFIALEWKVRAETVRRCESRCNGKLVHIQH